MRNNSNNPESIGHGVKGIITNYSQPCYGCIYKTLRVTKVYEYTWNTLVDYGRPDSQKANRSFMGFLRRLIKVLFMSSMLLGVGVSWLLIEAIWLSIRRTHASFHGHFLLRVLGVPKLGFFPSVVSLLLLFLHFFPSFCNNWYVNSIPKQNTFKVPIVSVCWKTTYCHGSLSLPLGQRLVSSI